METTIKWQDRVVTADGYLLGLARNLHHRPEDEVNAEDQLYSVYLEVNNFELGDDFFVPLEFILDRDPETRTINLDATMKEALQLTWSRMPEFVALMQGRKEPLPRGVEAQAAAPKVA